VVFTGKVASPGFARGPLVRVDRVGIGSRRPESPEQEASALRAALDKSGAEIAGLADAAGGEAAAILEFQLALLDDESLVEPAFAAIDAGIAADAAWVQALAEQVAIYADAPDEYLRAGSADLIDLRDRVLAALGGRAPTPRDIPAGAVVCADDFPPSRFLELDWLRGGGIALEQGSATSHVAMLARARGVPMLVQLGGLPEAAEIVLLDGEQGTLELDPPEARLAEFEQRRVQSERGSAEARAVLAAPAPAWRGEPVRLLINIQGLADLSHPDAQYAAGIGLMRTEFLFDQSAGLPDEDTQYRVYRAVLDWAGERPVTIRTLDAGGDKPVSGFSEAGEANPFLGLRGLRLSLKRPDVFTVQLRALARGAVRGKLKVMLPMVTVPAEFAAARALFHDAVDALRAAGVAAATPELGMMVEVPAAALTIADFGADFFSIGSNDLAQYVTACDRGNASLAALLDPLNPGVLELIRRTVEHGRRRGIAVSLCGDMAGEPRCVPALLHCGLRELSMAPPALARVKRAIAALG
jgi:phosphotransferase system enzyme I (PtsI)